ncbi:MAG TPA: glycosyltransferase family 2 protein [Egibacteraceae bacterium]
MRITVVTPTLNAERFLDGCLRSVRTQGGVDLEVEHVVVDGGSSDGTVARARAAGATVLEGRDEGIFDAINKGSFAGSGELLGFLGADDVLLPGALDAVADAYRRSGRRWVMGGCRWIDAHGTSRGDVAAPPTWASPAMLASLGWSCVHHLSTYVHRDLFAELGGFDTSYRYSGDYDFFLRARQREPFARIPRVLSAFRRHGANQSMSADPAHVAENERIAARYGYASPLLRQAARYALKTWLNATNPAWFVAKRVDARRARAA